MKLPLLWIIGCCAGFSPLAQGLSSVETALRFLHNPPVIEEVIWTQTDREGKSRHFFGRYQTNAIWLQELSEPTEDCTKFTSTNGLFIVRFGKEYWSLNMVSDGSAPPVTHWVDDGGEVRESDHSANKNNPLRLMVAAAEDVFSSILHFGIKNVRPGKFRIEGDGLEANVPAPDNPRPDGSNAPEVEISATLLEGEKKNELKVLQVRKTEEHQVRLHHVVQFSPTERTGDLVPTSIKMFRGARDNLVFSAKIHKITTSATPLPQEWFDPRAFIKNNGLDAYHLAKDGITFTNAFNQKIVLSQVEPWYAKHYLWVALVVSIVVAFFIDKRLLLRHLQKTK